jgi:hypothetical protein
VNVAVRAEGDVREPAAERRRRLRALLGSQRVAEPVIPSEVFDSEEAGGLDPLGGIRERTSVARTPVRTK